MKEFVIDLKDELKEEILEAINKVYGKDMEYEAKLVIKIIE